MTEIMVKTAPISHYQRACVDLNLLYDQRKELDKKMRKLEIERGQLNVEINLKEGQCMRLKKEDQKVTVTNHSIERFKQRVADIPDNRIKAILLSPEALIRYKQFRAGKFPIHPGSSLWVYLYNNQIVTCISRKEPMDKYPENRLKMLSKWMDIFINETIIKHSLKVGIYIQPFEEYFKENFIPEI